ncbi:MAG: hypothetical protein ACI88A_004960 [Paraglaciecola sp.]|jgi:hypothetical protein
MSAIQILEKLGANASFNLDQISNEEKKQLEIYIEGESTFHASLINTGPDVE